MYFSSRASEKPQRSALSEQVVVTQSVFILPAYGLLDNHEIQRMTIARHQPAVDKL
jgi:hypothetical protein